MKNILMHFKTEQTFSYFTRFLEGEKQHAATESRSRTCPGKYAMRIIILAIFSLFRCFQLAFFKILPPQRNILRKIQAVLPIQNKIRPPTRVPSLLQPRRWLHPRHARSILILQSSQPKFQTKQFKPQSAAPASSRLQQTSLHSTHFIFRHGNKQLIQNVQTIGSDRVRVEKNSGDALFSHATNST